MLSAGIGQFGHGLLCMLLWVFRPACGLANMAQHQTVIKVNACFVMFLSGVMLFINGTSLLVLYVVPCSLRSNVSPTGLLELIPYGCRAAV